MQRGGRWVAVLVAAAVLVGSVATWRVLDAPGVWTLARDRLVPLAGGIGVAVGCTLANLAVRWVRWNNLARRAYVQLPTRLSARVYGSTLPAIATPFYLAELVRPLLLRHHSPHAGPALVVVWVLERLADLVVVGAVALAATGRAWAILPVLVAWVAIQMWLPRRVPSTSSTPLGEPATVVFTAASTAVAWTLPAIGLWALAGSAGADLSGGEALSAFSRATVLGGLSGLPLGVAVTGLTLDVALRDTGVALAAAALVVGLFRAATVWFTVIVGTGLALANRRELIGLLGRDRRGVQSQFDEIAEGYEHQIPEQTRARLLDRKVDYIVADLRRRGLEPGARGLEVGCGHGWYAAALVERGYDVVGMDLSAGQLQEAHRHLTATTGSAHVVQGRGEQLPFADTSFDFAYAINVLHHVVGPDGRTDTVNDIVRILRPGAPFLLHEMNTRNPLFRFYMGYVFPLLHDIDEGTELWIRPDELPEVSDARWDADIDYFTFLPEFLPEGAIDRAASIEGALERSRWRWASAHFMARLVKLAPATRAGPTAR